MHFHILFILILTTMSMGQWSTDPLENSLVSGAPGEQAIPKAAITSTGETYISWFSVENGNYNIRLQYFDHQGMPQLAHDGMLVSDAPSMTWLTDYDLIIDAADHAVLTWQDVRFGSNNIVAQRISPAGDLIWGPDGLELSNNPDFEPGGKLAILDDGHILVAWQSAGDLTVIRMDKISMGGDLVWPDTIVLSAPPGASATYPQPVAAQDGSFILVWYEETGPLWSPNREIKAQRFSPTGDALWPTATSVSLGDYIPVYVQPQVISNEDGGCFIAWYCGRDPNPNHLTSFVQHVAADGSIQMETNGVELSTHPSNIHLNPSLVWNQGTQHLFAYWIEETANQNQYGISGQKLTANGQRLWGGSGLSIQPLEDGQISHLSARPAGNGVVLTYSRNIFGNVTDVAILALRLDADGAPVWPAQPVELSAVVSAKLHPMTTAFGGNQLVSCWGDERGQDRDIYAQNLSLSGTLGPEQMIQPGDVNGDGSIDVLDIVRAVNIIVDFGDPPTDYELLAADINGDEVINILDIVLIVNIIVGT